MTLLVVHDVCRYLRIVVFLRSKIFCIERFLHQKRPEIVLERFNNEVLCAHGAQPVDSLHTAATSLGVIRDASMARLHYN